MGNRGQDKVHVAKMHTLRRMHAINKVDRTTEYITENLRVAPMHREHIWYMLRTTETSLH